MQLSREGHNAHRRQRIGKGGRGDGYRRAGGEGKVAGGDPRRDGTGCKIREGEGLGDRAGAGIGRDDDKIAGSGIFVAADEHGAIAVGDADAVVIGADEPAVVAHHIHPLGRMA